MFKTHPCFFSFARQTAPRGAFTHRRVYEEEKSGHLRKRVICFCIFFHLKILPQKSYENRTEILQNSKNPQKATKKLFFLEKKTKNRSERISLERAQI
jgi:hypothetical protein